MTLTAQYQQAVADGHRHDPEQARVLAHFDGLLAACSAPRPRRLWPFGKAPAAPRGIYLWGGVGRGKTWLMDLFHDALPDGGKRRVHCHAFLQDIHDQLRAHGRQSNPLTRIARRIAGETPVLCLDEFAVVDIGDAVIIAGLLRALFDAGVTLVTTSNQPPERLYSGGIQRASFLPAIDLLQQHCAVLELGGDFDYRRQVAERAGIYHWPLDAASEAALDSAFDELATEPVERDGSARIRNRDIPFRRRAGGLAWFDFDALCGPPRSQADYIELARQHHTVLVSDIPHLDGSSDDRSRRLIMLIDEFYDRRVKVLISAATRPEALYCGERLAFEFQRTASRLEEMQTADYLSLPHRG